MHALSQLTGLRALHLADCLRLTDQGFRSLAPLINLRVLNLKGSCVTDQGLVVVSGLLNLRNLNLADCPHITDLDSLRTLAKLRRLDLSGCVQITDEGLHVLSFLRDLRALHLRGLPITDDGLLLVSPFPM